MRSRTLSAPIRRAQIPRFGLLALILVCGIVFLPRVRSLQRIFQSTPPSAIESTESEQESENPIHDASAVGQLVPSLQQQAAQPNQTDPTIANAEPSNHDRGDERLQQTTPTGSNDTAATDSKPVELAIDDQMRDLLSLVADNTLQLPKREMPAYWHLLAKSMSVPIADLQQTAKSGYKFNDFYSKPAKHRGELVNLDITVRRVTRYDAEPDNLAKVPAVYEIWGSTEQSHAWLYVFITDRLPDGFDATSLIAKKAKFSGYFFKILAYHPGNALANSKPLAAPLLIGRVDAPQVRAVANKKNDESYWGLIALVVIAVAFIGFRGSLIWMQRRRKAMPSVAKTETSSWEWMESKSS